MTKKDMIEIVCERLLSEHQSVRMFMAGFGQFEICHCPGCIAARKLLGIKEEVESD